jgi:hypothetical protein
VRAIGPETVSTFFYGAASGKYQDVAPWCSLDLALPRS